jgi:hypothetical protein
MTAQTQVPGTTVYAPSQPMRERAAWYTPGLLLILADLVLLIVTAIVFWQSAAHTGATKPVLSAGSPSSPRGGRTSSSSSASTRARSASPACSG